MEEIRGVVERITYHSDESGYGVIKVRVKGFSELLTLTGKFIEINVGTVIEAKGNFVVNKKFGKQFSVKKYKESLPASLYGIEKYLGSGLIEGIGSKFAKQIVEKFGKGQCEYSCFVPSSLPLQNENDIKYDSEMIYLISEANRQIGRLDEVED